MAGTHALRRALLAAVLCLAAGAAEAGDFEISGFVAGELRLFPESPQFPDQFETFQPSAIFEPELSYESGDGRHLFAVTPFARLDAQDGERTHADLREGYWQYVGDSWDVLVGVNQVFWGVTESRHLVNVINQIDSVEDLDEEDFLGQPMVNIGVQEDWGRVDLFLMSGFRLRTSPGRDGRLRGPLPVDDDPDDARFESDLGRARPEAALRYSQFFGDWDVGLHVFHGTGREPRFAPNAVGDALVPSYDVITQGGLDLQLTEDAWLWKLEALARGGQGEVFGAAVGGFEYTIFQIFESSADLGLLAEGLYDGRDSDVFPAVLDNDVFVGARLALNDVQDTQVLAGVITDVTDGSSSLRVEAERRLGESWKVELEAQAFFAVDGSNNLAGFENDSLVTLRISRFF